MLSLVYQCINELICGIQMENSGVVHMLMHTRTLELACVYKLLSRVGEGLRTVADAVSAHLREQGRALVTDTHHNTNAITFVQVTPRLAYLLRIYLTEPSQV